MHSVTPWAPSGKASPTPTGPTRLSRQNREREAALHPPRPTGALTLQTPPLLPPSRGHGHLGALLERHTVNLPRTQQRGPGEQPVRAAYRSPPHTSRPHARGCTLTHAHTCPVHTHARTRARSLTHVCVHSHVHAGSRAQTAQAHAQTALWCRPGSPRPLFHHGCSRPSSWDARCGVWARGLRPAPCKGSCPARGPEPVPAAEVG